MQELKMSPIPEYGDLMTVEDWLDGVETALFIDYDGDGHLATATERSNIRICPSDITKKKITIDPRWTHICWYNR